MKSLNICVYVLSLGLFSFALMGCADSSSETEEESEQHFVPLATLDSSLTRQERSAIIQSTSPLTVRVNRTVTSNAPWKEIDDEVRSLLDEYRGSKSWSVAQEIVANHMLQRVLIHAADSEKRNQAAAHYVTMLLDTGHRDERAFNAAFQMLKGYWEDGQLVDAVEDVLARESCKSCARGGVSEEALRAARNEMEALHERLQ